MEFTNRVELRDFVGRLLKTIPSREATAMIVSARAKACDRQRNGRVRGIQLTAALPVRIGLPKPPSLAQYMGQRYTFRDPKTHAVELRKIIHGEDEDRDLYRLAVTDNLVAIAAVSGSSFGGNERSDQPASW